jgi:hypothetical protein
LKCILVLVNQPQPYFSNNIDPLSLYLKGFNDLLALIRLKFSANLAELQLV